MKSIKTFYSSSYYINIMKVIISNKNDLNENLKQIKLDKLNIIKPLNINFCEISCLDSKQINNTLYKANKKKKNIIKINEYFHGIDRRISSLI